MNQYNHQKYKTFSQHEITLISHFNHYLAKSDTNSIISVSQKGIFSLPYTTRWSKQYKNQLLQKLYGVEEFITRHDQQSIITLLTLTGYQNGPFSIEHTGKKTSRTELFINLKRGWRHLSNLLKKICPNLEYVWTFEPHKSGYPHIHIAIFGYLNPDIQQRLTNLWTTKYSIGSPQHGINFSVKPVKESIKSIKNYLLKYIAKNLGADSRKSWSPELSLYHAIAWKHHLRFIGMSQTLSKYCNARKIRFKHQIKLKHIHRKIVQLPLPPLNKIELKLFINQYRYLPGHDPPTQKWHYTFISNNISLTLIHHVPIPQPNTLTKLWINQQLSDLMEYPHQFIPLTETQS